MLGSCATDWYSSQTLLAKAATLTASVWRSFFGMNPADRQSLHLSTHVPFRKQLCKRALPVIYPTGSPPAKKMSVKWQCHAKLIKSLANWCPIGGVFSKFRTPHVSVLPLLRVPCTSQARALFQMSHLKLHTSHFALHSELFTLHASHSTLHLISSRLSSSQFLSAHLFSYVIKFFETMFILSDRCSTFLISSKLFLTHLSSFIHH